MFYAHFVLAKKGPLARIWLAAHWDKKLTKAHVFETNIETSVDGILQPKVKMALRTSGHLLLGVVRIYSRKAKYLLADCNEAFVKIKMAFRPGMVDLPEENREAAVNAITLPEVFHDFDTGMPDLNDVDIEAQFSLNQSRAEEITMREDYGSIALVNADEGFGDMGFDTESPDLMRQAVGLEPSMEEGILFTDGPGVLEADKEKEPIPSTSAALSEPTPMEIEEPIRELGPDIISGGLFEGGLFDDTPMAEIRPPEVSAIEATPVPEAAESDDDMDRYGGPPSVGAASTDESRPPSAIPPTPVTEVAPVMIPLEEPVPEIPIEAPPSVAPLEQTTLLQNEDESFALPPVDASILRGNPKVKRKRKLIVDEVKNISGEEMKNQLSDTSDIVTTLDLAPPTRRLMHWKETGGVEKLFALPARSIPARLLFKNYQRHLTSRAFGTEDFTMLGDAEILHIEQQREAVEDQSLDTSKVLPRLTRKRKYPAAEPEPVVAPPTPSVIPEQEIPQIVPPEEALAVMMPQTPMRPETPLMPPTPSILQPPTPSMPPTPLMPATPLMMPSTPIPELLPPETPTPIEQQLSPEVMPPPPTPLPPPTPMEVDIPQLEAEQVSSILEESHISAASPLPPPPTPTPVETTPLEEMPAPPMPDMANMGYEEHLPMPTGEVSERVSSPWHEDYEFPHSEEPVEEQQVDETAEQFEERVLNKRAASLFSAIKSKLLRADKIYFMEMVQRNNNRKQAAQKFYSLLVLKKFQVLELQQDEPYSDILVTKGNKFENPVL